MRAMVDTASLVAILVAVMTVGVAPAAAERELSVYVVYQSSSKKLSTLVIDQASRYAKVKKYNTDLLMLADYTAKQRVVSKLKQSDYIVLVGENTADIFGAALDSKTVIKIENEAQTIALEFEQGATADGSARRE